MIVKPAVSQRVMTTESKEEETYYGNIIAIIDNSNVKVRWDDGEITEELIFYIYPYPG